MPGAPQVAVSVPMASVTWRRLCFHFRFRGAPIIPVAARPGGPEAPETETPQGISELIEVLAPWPAAGPSPLRRPPSCPAWSEGERERRHPSERTRAGSFNYHHPSPAQAHRNSPSPLPPPSPSAS